MSLSIACRHVAFPSVSSAKHSIFVDDASNHAMLRPSSSTCAHLPRMRFSSRRWTCKIAEPSGKRAPMGIKTRYKDTWLVVQWLFAQKMSQIIGRKGGVNGYDGFVDISRAVMLGRTRAQMQAVAREVLMSLLPPKAPEMIGGFLQPPASCALCGQNWRLSRLRPTSGNGRHNHFKAFLALDKIPQSTSSIMGTKFNPGPAGNPHWTRCAVTRALGSGVPGSSDSVDSKNETSEPRAAEYDSRSSSWEGHAPSEEEELAPLDDDALARLLVVVGAGSRSPFDGVPWEEVMTHTGQRLRWINPKFRTDVFTDDVLRAELRQSRSPTDGDESPSSRQRFQSALEKADVVVVVEVRDEEAATCLARMVRSRSVDTFLALDSAPQPLSCVRLGGIQLTSAAQSAVAPHQQGVTGEEEKGVTADLCQLLKEEREEEGEEEAGQTLLGSLAMALPWTSAAKKMKAAQRTSETVQQAWERRKADDVLFVLMLLIDSYVVDIPQLKNLRANNLSALWCMVTKCGPKIAACLADPTCSKALECLNKCPPNDQVCSYRCLVSYESPLLEDFSLCILQKNNCLGLSAEIPSSPEVQPMTSFRGHPLTHEMAEDLFIGWLGEEEYSWRVVAGQNAAYDQFPCQYQLFYRGRARNAMWYDPVFQVRTLDQHVVWRRRHYRVRRAQVPGTFHFSVLDNGVISLEYWRIVDVAEDLSWALFYYAGAAAAAGQSYMGAVLCTPDGKWPREESEERILHALESTGIKKWEMYRVDNSSCQSAPLGIDSKVGVIPLSSNLRLPPLSFPAVVSVNDPS
ncbi:hypothetical protein CBR_g8843 [Chara braunii]|uniref:VDE lipocalin domain-containing protein n=1 Tax=Chara braunii TaxID=69332 RepID=A0A388KNA4_CHABU|nr:hypothetical protein CBR_g8843 [Chara braunii]|eukprot:GBG71423.1 hypothetical protein CBR_g8843 [Chara braunii]